MNPIDGMLEYFKVLGNSVDSIITNTRTLIEAMNYIMIGGGIAIFILLLMVMWQGASISAMSRKLDKIDDLLSRRGYGEGQNHR